MKDIKDLITGIIFIAVGAFFRYHGNYLANNSVISLDPGYFPNLISTGLIIVGSMLVIKSWNS